MAHGLILSDWKIPCTMKKKSILFVLAAICLPLAVSAQKEREITLNEAIAMARMQSVDAAVALNELKTSYWEYRTFRADLLPEINLKGTLPNYNKSYGSYQNPDGSYSFVRNSALGLSGELSIDQNIWLTGGQLSLTSSLDYLKQLEKFIFRNLSHLAFSYSHFVKLIGIRQVLTGGSKSLLRQQQIKVIGNSPHRHFFGSCDKFRLRFGISHRFYTPVPLHIIHTKNRLGQF